MKIKNTTEETTCPWPEGIFIQGSKEGMYRDRAFIEVSPSGTFIRTDADTLVEAEQLAWVRYELFLNCIDRTGEHGPFEPGRYTNGAGYCTKCGMWMSNVLTPTLEYLAEERASVALHEQYGDGFMWHPRRSALIKEEAAIIRAIVMDEPLPERTVEPPTKEELDALIDPEDTPPFTDEDLATVLNGLLNASRSIETPVENDITTP